MNTEDCVMNLSWKDRWRQKGFWNLASEKRLQDRGALPREEGDVIRECNAMHEENFLTSWPREDLVGGKKKEGRQGNLRRGEDKGEKK